MPATVMPPGLVPRAPGSSNGGAERDACIQCDPIHCHPDTGAIFSKQSRCEALVNSNCMDLSLLFHIVDDRMLLSTLLLMIDILRDFMYQNPRYFGSIGCLGSCRISIINTMNKRPANTGMLLPSLCCRTLAMRHATRGSRVFFAVSSQRAQSPLLVRKECTLNHTWNAKMI